MKKYILKGISAILALLTVLSLSFCLISCTPKNDGSADSAASTDPAGGNTGSSAEAPSHTGSGTGADSSADADADNDTNNNNDNNNDTANTNTPDTNNVNTPNTNEGATTNTDPDGTSGGTDPDVTANRDPVGTDSGTTPGSSDADPQIPGNTLNIPSTQGIAIRSKNYEISAPLFSFIANMEACYYFDAPYLFNIDINLPFHKQICDEESGLNWAEYIITTIASDLVNLLAACEAITEEGVTLTAEDKKELLDYLAVIEKEITEKEFKGQKYATLEEYLKANYGNTLTSEDVKYYYELLFLSMNHYDTLEQKLLRGITDDKVEAYYQLNMAGEPKDTSLTRNMIVISFSDMDGDGKTDNEKAAAEKLLSDYIAGAHTAEAFESLGKTYEEQASIIEYYETDPESTPEEFTAWLFDAQRKTGDATLIHNAETAEYSVCLYNGEGGEVWFVNAKNRLLCDNLDKWIVESPKQYSITVDENAMEKLQNF